MAVNPAAAQAAQQNWFNWQVNQGLMKPGQPFSGPVPPTAQTFNPSVATRTEGIRSGIDDLLAGGGSWGDVTGSNLWGLAQQAGLNVQGLWGDQMAALSGLPSGGGYGGGIVDGAWANPNANPWYDYATMTTKPVWDQATGTWKAIPQGNASSLDYAWNQASFGGADPLSVQAALGGLMGYTGGQPINLVDVPTGILEWVGGPQGLMAMDLNRSGTLEPGEIESFGNFQQGMSDVFFPPDQQGAEGGGGFDPTQAVADAFGPLQEMLEGQNSLIATLQDQIMALENAGPDPMLLWALANSKDEDEEDKTYTYGYV